MTNIKKALIVFLFTKIVAAIIYAMLAIPVWVGYVQAKEHFILAGTIVHLFVFIVVMIFFKKYYISIHQLFKNTPLKQVIVLLVIALFLKLLFPLYGLPISWLKNISLDQLRILSYDDNDKLGWLWFMSFVFIGPIVEEFLYRGIILNLLRRDMALRYALIASSFLFAISHIEPDKIWFTFFYGLALGWIYLKTENLSTSVLLHIFINLIAYFTEFRLITAESPYFLPYYALMLIGVVFFYWIYRNWNRYFKHVNYQMKTDNAPLKEVDSP